MTIDEQQLDEFVSRFAGDLGAVFHAATILVGDRLGLYAAMSDSRPVTPGQLADRTGCDERYLAEWLAAQAASGYAEYDDNLFQGTDRFFRPNYIGNLVDSWLPALDGVVAELETGARVADVGCGYGSSTILMAKAFPNSTFVGSDPHAPSIDAARKAAAEAGVAVRSRSPPRATTPESATTS